MNAPLKWTRCVHLNGGSEGEDKDGLPSPCGEVRCCRRQRRGGGADAIGMQGFLAQHPHAPRFARLPPRQREGNGECGERGDKGTRHSRSFPRKRESRREPVLPLDTGFRRYDEWDGKAARTTTGSVYWIPACAGMRWIGGAK